MLITLRILWNIVFLQLVFPFNLFSKARHILINFEMPSHLAKHFNQNTTSPANRCHKSKSAHVECNPVVDFYSFGKSFQDHGPVKNLSRKSSKGIYEAVPSSVCFYSICCIDF